MTSPSGPLLRLAVHGVAWTGFAQLMAQLLRLLVTAILARLLLPADFGVVGMALIVTGFIILINDLGLTAALVQSLELDESQRSTAFTTNVVAGILLSSMTALSSPLVARFFRNDAVQPVLMVLSGGFIIGAFGLVHRALLQRALRFRALAITQIAAEAAFGVLATSLALAGAGIWALVAGFLGRTAVQSALSWAFSGWHPTGLAFDGRQFRKLFSFSVNVLGSQVVNYLGANVDYLVIGSMLGDAALGYYTLAYTLTMFARMRIVSLVSQVAFPTFSVVQSDHARLRRAYVRMLTYVSMVAFPFIVGLFAVAPEAITVIVGPRWHPAIRPLQILCIGALPASVGATFGSILKARGRPDVEFRMNLLSTGVLTGLAVVGVRYGIEGVAAAVTLKSLVLITFFFRIVLRLIGMDWRALGESLRPATPASAVLLVFCLLLRANLGLLSVQNDLAFLITAVVAGGIVYLISVYWLSREVTMTLFQLVLDQVSAFLRRSGGQEARR